MISKASIFVIATTVVLSSCNLLKKNSHKDDDLITMNLDTAQVVSTSPEPAQYQASFTRINDIIHTKLDVNFDWSKQYMYGKAAITVKPYFYPTSTLALDARGMELKEISLVKTVYTTDVKQSNIKGKISFADFNRLAKLTSAFI